jgi:hypothetical protein
MTRSRGQAGKPQAMQQIVDTCQRIFDPEFLLEDTLSLFTTQRADTVGLRGIGQETLFEGLFLRRR